MLPRAQQEAILKNVITEAPGISDGEAETEPAPVPFATRFAWGVGSLGTIGYLNTVTALVLVYFTTILKIEPAVAGALVAGARVIDAFSDPLMGWVTDRTETRWGRRRPYLLGGALFCGLMLPLVYSMHLLPGNEVGAGVAFTVLVAYSLGFTVFNVPYLTMPVEMTEHRLERIQIMSYRVVFMMLGALLGNAAAPYLVDALGGGADAFSKVGMIMGAVVCVAMLITFLGTSSTRITQRSEKQEPFREVLKAIISNRPFMTLVGIKVMQFIAIAASGATSAFFVTIVLKQTFSLLSVFGLATTASILLSVPFWRWVSRFMTKKWALMIGLCGETASLMIWLAATPDNAYTVVVIRAIIGGFFSANILLNSQTMWLDTIDFDRQRSGIRREGVFTSVYVFVERLGYSIAPLVLGILLSRLGFDKSLPLAEQPESAYLAVYIGILWLPAGLFTACALLLTRYNLKEQVQQSDAVSP
jgi:GPH family glycoside/pentoside/hexuronide:cation symporter